jgi:hypothetical protein
MLLLRMANVMFETLRSVSLVDNPIDVLMAVNALRAVKMKSMYFLEPSPSVSVGAMRPFY